MKVSSIFVFVTLIFLMGSFCIYKYQLDYPNYFPAVKYDFSRNPLDENTIQLGRKLFYDPILSADQSISCASCHSPFNAFAHTDHSLSHGIQDQIGQRNAPALFNLAWHESFMWDGAINHLDVQALAPISHSKEMASSIQDVITRLNSSSEYRELFFKTYHDSLISSERILKSLAQFQLSLVSANSRYDSVRQGKVEFNLQERNGYHLFIKHCNSCHTEPLFTNHQFKSNGLSVDTTLNDYGRWNITKVPSDSLLFKVPSLRNLSYTYPYMHDGRFNKISQVIDHYSKGIDRSANLSKELNSPILLSSNEKVDLISFLLTLNDKAFVFNPKHQFPKKFK